MTFNQTHNAALVIPMFGDNRWPYIDLWLSSVARQPMDVLFITDFNIGDVPPNVKVINMSMGDVYDRAERCFNISFSNRFAYKLCDLKSFYGKIFEDLLQGYEFWGYGDCDVCYGELPQFGECDLYCGCHERDDMDMVKSETPLGRWFIPGHFVMMRNNKKSREIFTLLPTAGRLLADDVNRYIDEHLTPTVLLHIFPNRFNIRANDYQYLGGTTISLVDGLLSFDGRAAHYIHFYTHKSKVNTPNWRDIPRTFNVRSYVRDE